MASRQASVILCRADLIHSGNWRVRVSLLYVDDLLTFWNKNALSRNTSSNKLTKSTPVLGSMLKALVSSHLDTRTGESITETGSSSSIVLIEIGCRPEFVTVHRSRMLTFIFVVTDLRRSVVPESNM